MIKLLLCLMCAFAVGAAALQLRQQELEFKHQVAELQQKIQNQQARLWSQQLRIAISTAPNAITRMVGDLNLNLEPEARLPAKAADWLGNGANEEKDQ